MRLIMAFGEHTRTRGVLLFPFAQHYCSSTMAENDGKNIEVSWACFIERFSGTSCSSTGHASIRFQVASDEQSSSKVYFSIGDSY